jgi:hypothetical protein
VSWQLVAVSWVDAQVELERWHYEDALAVVASARLPEVKSIGHLVYVGEHHITLAMTARPDGAGELLKIPRGWITRIRELGEKRKKVELP